MAIGYVGAGALGYGTTAPAAAYPTEAVEDALVLLVGAKPFSSTIATPSGWVAAGTITNGTTATGADTGSTKAAAFVREASGTESGSLTLAVTSGNPSWAQILCFSKDAAKDWSFASATATDTVANTAFSATASSNPGITAGDVLVLNAVNSSDIARTWSSHAVTATGATFGAVTVVSSPSTATGNDGSGQIAYVQCTGGTATAAPVWTATLSSATNALYSVTITRLREVDPPAGPASGALVYTETFTGTDGADWGANWTLLTGDDAGTTTRSIQGNKGRQTGAANGAIRNDMLTGLADVANFDLTVDFDPGVTTGSGSNPAFFFRGDASQTSLVAYYLDMLFLSPTTGRLRLMVAPAYAGLQDHLFTHAEGTLYRLRIKANSTSIQAKIWPQWGSEPTTWGIDYTGSQRTTGRFGMTMFALQAQTVEWENLTIWDLNAPTVLTVDGATAAQTVGAVVLGLPVVGETWFDDFSTDTGAWYEEHDAGSGSFSIASGMMTLSTTANVRYAIANTASGDLAGDREILAKTRSNRGTAWNSWVVHTDGTTSSDGYYACFVGGDSIKIWHYSGGAYTSIAGSGDTYSFTWTANTWYWIRFGVLTDGTVRMKVWADGGSEPGSWLWSAVDATPLPVGRAAVGGNDTGATWDFDYVSTGDGGLTAPSPSDATNLVVAGATAAQTVEAAPLVQQHTVVVGSAEHAQTVAAAGVLTQQHSLAVQDATQAQDVTATGALVQDSNLLVDGSSSASSVDPVVLVQQHTLTVQGARNNQVADESLLTVQFTAVVQGTEHSQSVTEPGLTVQSSAVVQAVTQPQTVEAVLLTQAHDLAITFPAQAQTVTAAPLVQRHQLVLEDDDAEHTVGSVLLVQAHALAVAEATQAQSADPVVLAVTSYLTVDGAAHDHTAEEFGLEVTGDAAPASTVHAQTVDPVALAVVYHLEADGTLQDQTAGSTVLAVLSFLTVQGALSEQTVTDASLVQGLSLAPASATHAQTVTALVSSWPGYHDAYAGPGLTQVHELTVAGTAHAQTVTSPALVSQTPGSLTVASTTHAQDAGGSFPLTQVHVLAPAGTGHAQTVDHISVTDLIGLVVASATQLQEVADAGALAQLQLLVVAGAHQPQSVQHVAVVHVFAGNPDVTVTVWGPTCASVHVSSPTVTFVVTSPTV